MEHMLDARANVVILRGIEGLRLVFEPAKWCGVDDGRDVTEIISSKVHLAGKTPRLELLVGKEIFHFYPLFIVIRLFSFSKGQEPQH